MMQIGSTLKPAHDRLLVTANYGALEHLVRK